DGESLLGFDMDFGALARRRVSPAGADWADHFYANGSLRRELWEPSQGPKGKASGRYFESWAGDPASRR
ncbi:unnamed protein product, partial [Effrenium voratum]